MNDLQDIGYLQFGSAPGPFYTVSVHLKHKGADNWFALFESRWRKVHIQVRRTYIVYLGERITINIEGV